MMPNTAAMAATALQVACIVSSGDVQAATCAMSELLVGAGSHGYSRPVSSALQQLSSGQTAVLVPGADGMLVAEAPSIKQHFAKACTLASPFRAAASSVAAHDLISAVEYVCSFGGDFKKWQDTF